MQRRLTEISWEQAWHHNSLELIGMTPTFAIWMAIIVLAIVIAITGIVMYRYGIQMWGVIPIIVGIVLPVTMIFLVNNVAMENHDRLYEEQLKGKAHIDSHDKIKHGEQQLTFQAGKVTKTVKIKQRVAFNRDSEIRVHQIHPELTRLHGKQRTILGNNPHYHMSIKDKDGKWVKILR